MVSCVLRWALSRLGQGLMLVGLIAAWLGAGYLFANFLSHGEPVIMYGDMSPEAFRLNDIVMKSLLGALVLVFIPALTFVAGLIVYSFLRDAYKWLRGDYASWCRGRD